VTHLFLTHIFLQAQGSGNSLALFMPMILIFAIMYFLIFRPQAKKQKEHQKMIAAVTKGDKVITAGGIYGTVVGVKEKEGILIVEIDKNVKVELTRSSIAKKLD
jgi:preprotein translocase subunit YajC